MLERSTRLTTVLFVFMALALPVAAAAVPADSEPVVPAERPDDPPAPFRAVDDPQARSFSTIVTQGSYVSIQVNVDNFGNNIVGDAANEPSIAVSPVNPGVMAIGWRQFDSISSNFRQAGWAHTANGGQTWTFPGVLTPGTFRSDPVLDTDSSGNFYYQSLESSFDVQVFKSTDGGATWGTPVDEFGGDKNWFAIDKTGGPSDGHQYGIWQRFAGCCGQRTLTRSTDGGLSFEEPVSVARRPTFGTIEVGPDGTLYMGGIDGTFGQDFDTFVVAWSTDAREPGVTPSTEATIVDLNGSMRASAGPNPGGLLGQANVGVDPSHGPLGGYAYLVASVDPPGSDPLDASFARSRDGGVTWSDPVRINDDPEGNGAWQWFAAHSVAPNSRIDAIFNDTRGSGVATVSQLYYTYSWDAGLTWSKNVAVSPPFDSTLGYPSQNKIGDYYTIISNETGADIAYSATFNLEQDVYYLRVFPDCNGNGISDVTDIAGGLHTDCDSSGVPDVCEFGVDCTAAGSVPDGSRIPGVPLLLGKLAGGEVRLTWGDSCYSGDSDYEIYQGSLGDFDDYEPLECSTGSLTTHDLVPSPDSVFYLVVPTNLIHEGSYGADSQHQERLQSLMPCLPRNFVSCPVEF